MLISARTDDPIGKALVDDIADAPRSRLFVVEGLNRAGLIAYLATNPLLDRLLAASRGRPEDVDELLEALPVDTDALLHQRMTTLSDPARRILVALAVLGRPATADLLAAIIGAYDGFFGPGTGTFLIIGFVNFFLEDNFRSSFGSHYRNFCCWPCKIHISTNVF